MQPNNGHFIVFGDFNEVRHASERFGSVFNQQGANAFNEFINQTKLVDLNIGGHIDVFHDVVVQSYNDFDGDQEVACNYLKNKMKYLKGKIKDWHKDFKVAQTTSSKSLCNRIGAIEDKMDDMTASEEDVAQQIFWLKELADIERLEVIDVAQKSKIKW
ncbi:hypothetical protein Tco_0968371 [Tanacetum coccineum]